MEIQSFKRSSYVEFALAPVKCDYIWSTLHARLLFGCLIAITLIAFYFTPWPGGYDLLSYIK